MVQVQEVVAISASKEESSYENFFDNPVKCRFCIKEESIHWCILGVEGMLNNLSQEETGKLMRAVLSLVLSDRLLFLPVNKTQLPDLKVKSLCHQRTGGNRPIQSI